MLPKRNAISNFLLNITHMHNVINRRRNVTEEWMLNKEQKEKIKAGCNQRNILLQLDYFFQFWKVLTIINVFTGVKLFAAKTILLNSSDYY